MSGCPTSTMHAMPSGFTFVSESKQLTIRIDARSVMNLPEPFTPILSTNDAAISQFGIIECGCGDSKSGRRTFQAQVRLTF